MLSPLVVVWLFLFLTIVHVSSSSSSSSPTSAPTTSAPTTPAPSTPIPTTLAPITSTPTTSVPTSPAPTTLAPSPASPLPSPAVSSAPTTVGPTNTSSSLAPSFAPSSFSQAPSTRPTTSPLILFQPFEFWAMNSTALNISLSTALSSYEDDTEDFVRIFKGHVFQMMSWPNYPYGPRIDVIKLKALSSNSMSMNIVMEKSYNEALASRIQNNLNNSTNSNGGCVGYICNVSQVLGSESVKYCKSVGWASKCPAACHQNECNHDETPNNQCLLNADWETYTCSCLSMNFRTGANAQTCDPLTEVSIVGVIGVAITGFLVALILFFLIWRQYALYHRGRFREPARTLARPQRVNTIGRISPVNQSRRTSSISPATNTSASPDNSLTVNGSTGMNPSGSRIGRPSSAAARGLIRSAALSPTRPAEKVKRTSGSKQVSPDLDPFNHKVNNKFQQMNFDGQKTKFSRLQAFTVFVSATCALVPAGLGLIIVTTDIVRQELRYDNLEGCDLTRNPAGTICLVKMVIDQDMQAPLHFHYRLNSFYQNHRSYVISRDEKQLRGADDPEKELPNCEPLSEWEDDMQAPFFTPTFIHANSTKNNTNMSNNATNVSSGVSKLKKLFPCGLIAQSWFNDMFGACYTSQNETFCDPLEKENWNKQNIVYEWDKKYKFLEREPRSNETRRNYFLGYQMPSLQDEDFIGWMRVAPKDSFSKFYRNILNQSLKAGDTLTFVIQNNFPSQAWEGQKAIVISTASMFGGKTNALGQLYVTVGCMSAVFAVVLWLFGGADAQYHTMCQNCCSRSSRRRSMNVPKDGMRLD